MLSCELSPQGHLVVYLLGIKEVYSYAFLESNSFIPRERKLLFRFKNEHKIHQFSNVDEASKRG